MGINLPKTNNKTDNIKLKSIAESGVALKNCKIKLEIISLYNDSF